MEWQIVPALGRWLAGCDLPRVSPEEVGIEMEDYLRNMKNLRAQMNEFEEEAASVSVEEQKQKTAIDAVEKDLQSVRLETKRLNEEADELMKARAQICCQILEKQKKISSLGVESGTLSQTLELLQKEILAFQEKLGEKRMYYEKVREELNSKLHDQQGWVDSQKLKLMTDTASVEEGAKKLMGFVEGGPSRSLPSIEGMSKGMDLINQLESARAELKELKAKTFEVSLNNNKSRQHIAELQLKIEGFPSELKGMEVKTLEEEHQALLADKSGELEYLQSLQERIEQLQGMSEAVKCQCGEEYKVELRN